MDIGTIATPRPIRRAERRTGRAVVLGASIAFGSCTLAACTDEPDDAKAPLLAAASVPAEQEAVERQDEPTLALDAREGSLATVEVSPGFTPDPLRYEGSTGPRTIDAHDFDERCRGWLSPEPELVLSAERPFAELAVMVASTADVTVLVVGPDGDARCGDDEEGTHAIVRDLFEQGTYRMWVGTAEREEGVRFVLALSELEETRPSHLLQ